MAPRTMATIAFLLALEKEPGIGVAEMVVPGVVESDGCAIVIVDAKVDDKIGEMDEDVIGRGDVEVGIAVGEEIVVDGIDIAVEEEGIGGGMVGTAEVVGGIAGVEGDITEIVGGIAEVGGSEALGVVFGGGGAVDVGNIDVDAAGLVRPPYVNRVPSGI